MIEVLLPVRDVVQTCWMCTSQWDAVTLDGRAPLPGEQLTTAPSI